MKLQKLTIHNIASIEDAVIDFDTYPLSSSEVFLISGKTGAGKSTILDAICLALYATTPRLENTNMQGESKDGSLGIKIYDPRQLMRRNTGEAFVELTFTGSNGIKYEARWSVARARGKVSGNLQGKKWQLKNLDEDFILTKDKEIEDEIKVAVGLQFNQFCRTTMLAQGEFTRFLNSNDKDKAEILEKITGVDIYSKIGRKVYEVTSQKEQIWRDAARLVEGTKVLNDEEIATAQDNIKAIDEEHDMLKSQQKVTEAKLAWLNEETKLKQQEKEDSENLAAATAKCESEEAANKILLVKQWNETIEARGWLKELKSARKKSEELTHTINEAREEYSAIKGGRIWLEADIEKKERQLSEIKNNIEAEKEKTHIYENAQTIGSMLEAIESGRNRIASETSKMEEDGKRLSGELTQKKTAAKESFDKAEDNLRKHTSALKDLERELTEHNLPELRKGKDALMEMKSAADTAIVQLDNLATERSRRKKKQDDIVEQEKNIESLTEKRKALEPQIHDAEVKTNTCKELLEKQRDSVDKWAKAMRGKLKPGDVCPVCRREIEKELPHEEELDAFVAAIQEEWTNADAYLNKLKDEMKSLDSDIKSHTASLKKDVAELEADTSLTRAEEAARNAIKKCGFDNIDDNTKASISSKADETKERLNKLDEKINAAETLEKKVKQSREEADRLRDVLDKARETLDYAKSSFDICQASINTSKELIKRMTDETAYAVSRVNELLGESSWRADWNACPAVFWNELSDKAAQYESYKKEFQKLENKVNEKKTCLGNVDRPLSAIDELMPEWKDVVAREIKEISDLVDQANNLRTSIHSTKQQLRDADDEAARIVEALNAYYNEHPEFTPALLSNLDMYKPSDISSISEELSKLREEMVARKTILEQTIYRINDHNGQKPELKEGDSPDSLDASISQTARRIEELQNDKGRISLILEQDAENKKALAALLADTEQKKAVYDQWHRMNELIGDANGNKFRKIAQSYVLSSLIHSANGYMQMLTDRYTLKVSPGTFVIMVEDAYQGYAARAASTISGGEGFLVSLALALALSDIGNTLSVDTLFIDEGFGTLSGEPLQRAIDTLRGLHSKAGRHVGIISHVEELRERIPVQIRVDQEGNNSKSEVSVIPQSAS